MDHHNAQNAPVDPAEMRMTLKLLRQLKREYDRVKNKNAELEEESKDTSNRIKHVEDLLKRAEISKPVTFSTITFEDLRMAGVKKKNLSFETDKVLKLKNSMTVKTAAQVADLHARVKKIHAHVNTYLGRSSRTILNEILLYIAEIVSTEQKRVRILLGTGAFSGVSIINHVSGCGLLLGGGKLDYVITRYNDIGISDNGCFLSTSADYTIATAINHLLIVEAKRQEFEHNFDSHIPEAVSQAIVYLKSKKLTEVRFCLSDGHAWLFFILKLEGEIFTYYQSTTIWMRREDLNASDSSLREIVQLLCEWLIPIAKDIVTLEGESTLGN